VKHKNAKPLKGFSGAGVIEIVESFEAMPIAPSTRSG
jgi:hypothetical protein